MPDDTAHTFDGAHSAGSERLEQFHRNLFFHGKLMTARDMVAEQDYHASRLETFTRTVAGDGVVCGLETSVTDEEGDGTLEVTVQAGYALDDAGRPIVLPDADDEAFTQDERSTAPLADPESGEDDGVSLYVEYEDCSTERVPQKGSEDACGEDCTYNRIVSDYEIVLKRGPPAAPKPVYDVTFPTRAELEEYEDDDSAADVGRHNPMLHEIARSYTEHRVEHEPTCGATGEGQLFLGHWIEAGDTWELQEEPRPRPRVYSADMLYAAIARHVTDYDNPHGSVATVEGVGPDEDGDVGVDADDTIDVDAPAADDDHALHLAVDGDALGLDEIRERLDRLEGFDHEAPDAPTDLEVQEARTHEVDLRWEEASDDVGVRRYRVFVDGEEVTEVVAPRTTTTVTGLDPDTAYEFTVTAVDAAGNESEHSEPAAATTEPEPEDLAPPAPRNLAVLETMPGFLRVGWDDVGESDDWTLDHYAVRVTNRDDAIEVPSDETEVEVDGLQPGTGYRIGVAAVDEDGDASEQTTITAPTSLDEVAARAPTRSEVEVAWGGPARDGLAVDRYVVYRQGERDQSVRETNAVVRGLAPGTQFTVGVGVEVDGNESPPGVRVIATTPANLSLAERGNTTLTVEWNGAVRRAGAVPKEYHVEWQNAQEPRDGDEALTEETTFEITGLEAGTTYDVDVSAVSDHDVRSEPARITGTTIPRIE